MYKRQLCLSLMWEDELSLEERVDLTKNAGFDGFFVGYRSDEQIKELRRLADEKDMFFQSIHARFHKSNMVWYEDERGDEGIQEVYDAVSAASKYGVDLVVAHSYIGFYTGEKPTKAGLDRIKKVLDYAKELNIKIAYENIEGEEFLDAIMDAFYKDYDNLGFCWDSGHEQCYNYSKDMLAKYGAKVFGTHLNDNLGVKDFNGKMFWYDDLHLLPFDGVIDWKDAMERLAKTGFDGPLTFELKTKHIDDRHENDKYCALKKEEYLAEAYTRACKLGFMFNKIKGIY
ncbi:MAG: sugar phosphate isomerase/epimerase [Clostridia bacterium]|nr:sugar phosphate isomerase/epimerase [Clostridia bacterium]